MKRIIILFLLTLLCSGCLFNIPNDEKIIDKSDDSMITDKVKVKISDKEYVLNLEDNDTALEFIKMLPREFSMSDLNKNEKYSYLDSSLPTKDVYPKHINAGDVYLFGDNCLVVFYKSFDTSYSYTKIGHIDNLSDLGSGSIVVKFVK